MHLGPMQLISKFLNLQTSYIYFLSLFLFLINIFSCLSIEIVVSRIVHTDLQVFTTVLLVIHCMKWSTSERIFSLTNGAHYQIQNASLLIFDNCGRNLMPPRLECMYQIAYKCRKARRVTARPQQGCTGKEHQKIEISK